MPVKKSLSAIKMTILISRFFLILAKYLDDATQHQSQKDSMRAKRAVYPVPQTDSDAAKGIIIF